MLSWCGPQLLSNPSNLLFWQCLAGPCVCLPVKRLSVASSSFNKFFDDSPPFSGGKKTHTSTNLYQSLFFLILTYTLYLINPESCGLNQKKRIFFSIVVPTTRVSLFFSFLVWLGIISLSCQLAMLQPGISHKESGSEGLPGLGWLIGMSVGD